MNWDSVLHEQNAATSYANFSLLWDMLYEQCFPLKKVFTNRNKFPICPFFTKGLLTSRKHKNCLYKSFLKTRTLTSEQNYRPYNRAYNKVVKAAKKLYFNSNIDNNSNPKTAWKFLNEAIGKNKSSSCVLNNLSVNGNTISNSIDMANCFNDFFASIPDKITAGIHPSNVNFKHFMPEPSNQQFNFRPVPSILMESIIKILESKQSLDINGIRKFVKKMLNLHFGTTYSYN